MVELTVTGIPSTLLCQKGIMRSNWYNSKGERGMREQLNSVYFPAGLKPWQADRGKQHHENSARGRSSAVLSAGAVNQVPYHICQAEMLQYKMQQSQSSGGCH